MAAFTRAEIHALVRKTINEPTANVFTDTEIDDLIDQGARSVSILTLCNSQTEIEGTLVEGCMYRALSTHFTKVESVWYYNGTRNTGLQRIDPRHIGHVADATEDEPRWYFIFEQGLFTWPPNDATTATAGNTLTVLSYAIVDDYGAGAAETLPNEVQPYCIDYALAWAYAKLGKHSLNRYYMQRYLAKCFSHRRNVYDAIGMVDSRDRFDLPDFTVQAQ